MARVANASTGQVKCRCVFLAARMRAERHTRNSVVCSVHEQGQVVPVSMPGWCVHVCLLVLPQLHGWPLALPVRPLDSKTSFQRTNSCDVCSSLSATAAAVIAAAAKELGVAHSHSIVCTHLPKPSSICPTRCLCNLCARFGCASEAHYSLLPRIVSPLHGYKR